MRDVFIDIISSLKQNKLRTALTGFAVAWGIFMLIALLGAGNGVLNALLDNSSVMENSMLVYPRRTTLPYGGFKEGRWISFDARDVADLEGDDFSRWVDEVSPMVYESTSLVYGDKYYSCSLYGVNPVYSDINNIDILSGRFINHLDVDDKRKSVVIGSGEVEQLLGEGAAPSRMLGKWVNIGPFKYKVVGVYKTDESAGGENVAVYAPFTTISTIYAKGKDIGNIRFSFHGLESEAENEEFEKAFRRSVNIRHFADPDDEGTVYIRNQMTSNQQMSKAIRIIRTALWILGLFTLLSGIVGVSNIMLITVKERTHEFGIRKAIGAKPWDVLKLVITESVMITAFFGYIGMILGLVANQIMDSTMGGAPVDVGIVQMTVFLNPTVGIDVAVKATLVLIIAGTLAGMVPALKAANIKPIEALRSE